ncbi:MFS transporter [Lentzea sp. PSKA42]|uniref:MFS transporter n=1 Tax=Lentzea indica TaxID=2604800 RepID=A0ABX1FIS5_9PSEU|nr:MFS transporter [Lentzea indica]NKE58802.1 MFS transporter [Lentzea indica]
MTAVNGDPATRLWGQPGFRNLWIGLTASEFGSQLTRVAVPLVAVLALNASSEQVGLLAAATQLPYILVALVAGVFVDRLSPRRMLIGADLGRLVLLAVIPLMYATDLLGIGWLYVIAFATGTCTVLFDVASQANLPLIVHRDQLASGNGAMEASRSASTIAGPAAGGALVQVFTAPLAVAAGAVAYLVSVIAVWRTPTAGRTGGQPPTGGVIRQIREGIRVVFGNEVLRIMAIVAGVYNLFFAGYQTVNLLFLTRELNLSASAVGIVLGALGPGLLVGASVAAWLPRRIGYGPTILLTAIGANGVVQVMSLVHGNGVPSVVALVAVNLAFGGFGLSHAIVMRTIRQVMTPNEFQGRVAATNRFFAQGATPIGALLGGVLGGLIGFRSAQFVMTLGMLSVVVPLALSSLPRIGKDLSQVET